LPFTGFYEHTIDAKHRLAIPAEIRALVTPPPPPPPPEGDGGKSGGSTSGGPVVFYVTLGEKRSLCLYPEKEFEKRAAALDDSELDADEVLSYEEVFFGLARRVEMDAAGRVRLPEHLIKMAKLGPEVVLVGSKDHLRIRDRAEWLARVQRVVDNQEDVLNPRRLLRRRRRGDDKI
jgi:transcriptional regulator MraZ